MKRIPILLLTLITFLFLSCESQDEKPKPDDYNLLAVIPSGEIFEIGNNTGKITKVSQIENQSGLIMPSTVCNTGGKIYGFESSYVPRPNILLEYDNSSRTTRSIPLSLPASITSVMIDPFITNLKYNGTELIAIVNENQPSIDRPNKIVSINIQNYEVTDLGISFFQRQVYSIELIGNKLYIGTFDGLLEVNLTEKTVNELLANGNKINKASWLAKIIDTKLGLMKLGAPGIVNGAKPYEYDLVNHTLTDKSSPNYLYSTGTLNGNAFALNGEYLTIVGIIYRDTSKLGILRFKVQSNKTELFELDYKKLDKSAVIVGTTDTFSGP